MAIEQLIRGIHRLNELHVKLLDLADEKRDIVIQDRINDLVEITSTENTLVKEISKLELACRQLVQQVSEEFNIPSDTNTNQVSNLILALGDGHATERRDLEQARQELTDTVTRLKEKNELNRQLIQQSLDYISFSIDLLTDAPDQDMMYQKPSSNQQVKKRTGLFDQKA